MYDQSNIGEFVVGREIKSVPNSNANIVDRIVCRWVSIYKQYVMRWSRYSEPNDVVGLRSCNG